MLTRYPWYFDPHPWYIESCTHGILTPYSWYYDPPANLLITNEVFQNTMRVQYIMGENRLRGQNTIGVKIQYDTGNAGSG